MQTALLSRRLILILVLLSQLRRRSDSNLSRILSHNLHLGIFPPRLLVQTHTTITIANTHCTALLRDLAIKTRRVDAQDASNVISVSRDTELPESIPPFVEELPYRFADFVFAVLAVVACAADSVHRARGGLLVFEAVAQVLDGFFWVKAVEVDVELFAGAGTGIEGLVAFIV